MHVPAVQQLFGENLCASLNFTRQGRTQEIEISVTCFPMCSRLLLSALFSGCARFKTVGPEMQMTAVNQSHNKMLQAKHTFNKRRR